MHQQVTGSFAGIQRRELEAVMWGKLQTPKTGARGNDVGKAADTLLFTHWSLTVDLSLFFEFAFPVE